ncbi:hypothetical protein [Lacipirellula sp.]|uniref:hypothetical protein n=1 Tax=Lacipirellula sp. TaxID=2691419 RepID=UPI003D0ACD95
MSDHKTDDQRHEEELPHLHTTAAHVHEDSDVSISSLGMFLGALAITMVVTGAVVVGLFDLFLDQAEEADISPSPLAESGEPPAPPGPLLQVAERLDLRLYRASQEKQIHETAWVDRDRGIVRIPIERAIEITAERGLPDWPPVAQGVAAESGAAQ